LYFLQQRSFFCKSDCLRFKQTALYIQRKEKKTKVFAQMSVRNTPDIARVSYRIAENERFVCRRVRVVLCNHRLWARNWKTSRKHCPSNSRRGRHPITGDRSDPVLHLTSVTEIKSFVASILDLTFKHERLERSI